MRSAESCSRKQNTVFVLLVLLNVCVCVRVGITSTQDARPVQCILCTSANMQILLGAVGFAGCMDLISAAGLAAISKSGEKTPTVLG